MKHSSTKKLYFMISVKIKGSNSTIVCIKFCKCKSCIHHYLNDYLHLGRQTCILYLFACLLPNVRYKAVSMNDCLYLQEDFAHILS